MRHKTLLMAIAAATAACDVPRDPDNTLRRVRDGVIRVGYSINAPWTTEAGASPGGIESDIASLIARSVNARIVWIKRPEADLMQSLHERQLDLVIGGLTMESAWSSHAAFTRSYYTDSIVVAADAGVIAPSSVKGARIAVTPGDPVAAVIRDKGGIVSPARDLDATPLPKARHIWQIKPPAARTGILLLESKHVIAVAPGENAWLVHIERVLEKNKSAIPNALRRSSR